MKREIISLCAVALVGGAIGVLGLSNHSNSVKQSSEKTTEVKKHKAQKKISKSSTDNNKQKEKSQTQSKQSANTQSQQQSKQSSVNVQQSSQTQNNQQVQQNHQPQQQKTQGQINKERGYDPKGNPLLPGQDHAAGSNPDGSPDSWVQGQSEWLRKNGLTNSDGTLTQKAKEQRAQEFKDESE